MLFEKWFDQAIKTINVILYWQLRSEVTPSVCLSVSPKNLVDSGGIAIPEMEELCMRSKFSPVYDHSRCPFFLDCT